LKGVREAARLAHTITSETPTTAETMTRSAGTGDQVEVAHLGLKGEILAIDAGTATVRAGNLTVKVPLQALRVVRPGAVPIPSRAGAARIQTPERSTVASELHLIGRTSDEARDLLEKYLDDAFLAGLGSVRIIHGRGTGALRRAVVDVLSVHPLVTEHRAGAQPEGGAGATVAVLGQD
jgi:DNA mismatch repair protein MutS2